MASYKGDENIKMEFAGDASSVLIRLLTDTYRVPLVSAIRETVQNALDASIGYEGADKKVRFAFTKIEGENGTINAMMIDDFGCGMDKDTLVKSFLSYANSTKINDDGTVGMFGLGAKSPLAYTSEMRIATKQQNGETLYAIAARDADGGASYSDPIVRNDLLTDREHGTQIVFPFRSHNDEYFDRPNAYRTAKAMSMVLGFDIVLPDDDDEIDHNNEKGGTFDAIVKNEPVSIDVYANEDGASKIIGGRLNASDVAVKVGGWLYALDGSSFNNNAMYSRSNSFETYPIVITLPQRFLSFIPSRDTIVVDEKLNNDVLNALNNCKSKMNFITSVEKRSSSFPQYALNSLARIISYANNDASRKSDSSRKVHYRIDDNELTVSCGEYSLQIDADDLMIAGKNLKEIADSPLSFSVRVSSNRKGYALRGGVMEIDDLWSFVARNYDYNIDYRGGKSAVTAMRSDGSDSRLYPSYALMIAEIQDFCVVVDASASDPKKIVNGLIEIAESGQYNKEINFIILPPNSNGVTLPKEIWENIQAYAGSLASYYRNRHIVCVDSDSFNKHIEAFKAAHIDPNDYEILCDAFSNATACTLGTRKEAGFNGYGKSDKIINCWCDLGYYHIVPNYQHNEIVNDGDANDPFWILTKPHLKADSKHIVDKIVNDPKHVGVVVLINKGTGGWADTVFRALSLGISAYALELIPNDIDFIVGVRDSSITKKSAAALKSIGVRIIYDERGKTGIAPMISSDQYDVDIDRSAMTDNDTMTCFNKGTAVKYLGTKAPDSVVKDMAHKMLVKTIIGDLKDYVDFIGSARIMSDHRSYHYRTSPKGYKKDTIVQIMKAFTCGHSDDEVWEIVETPAPLDSDLSKLAMLEMITMPNIVAASLPNVVSEIEKARSVLKAWTELKNKGVRFSPYRIESDSNVLEKNVRSYANKIEIIAAATGVKNEIDQIYK